MQNSAAEKEFKRAAGGIYVVQVTGCCNSIVFATYTADRTTDSCWLTLRIASFCCKSAKLDEFKLPWNLCEAFSTQRTRQKNLNSPLIYVSCSRGLLREKKKSNKKRLIVILKVLIMVLFKGLWKDEERSKSDGLPSEWQTERWFFFFLLIGIFFPKKCLSYSLWTPVIPETCC